MLIKKIIFTLAIFLKISVYGQSNDSLYNSKFDVGFLISPDYGYRILKTDAANNWIKDIYDTLEVSRYSYTAGFSVIFNLNKKISIGSGLLFSDKGEKTKKYLIQPTNNYTNHYYYIDVPLKANYNLTFKKLKLFLTAGLCANIYIKGKTQVNTASSGEVKTLDPGAEISAISFSFIGGLGFDYALTDRWYFKLEPNYRRFVTPMANSSLKRYPYSLGLNMGFFRIF